MNTMTKSITQVLKNLPTEPGVYLMKDKEGTTIYVGKAKNLKKRVPTYFQKNRANSPYTKKLVENIEDIEYIETNSEIEALILESNLVKEHQPRYNIILRDDKSFLYIKVSTGEDFPRIHLVRHAEMKKDKNAKYYGPKTSADKTRKTLKLLKKLFPHRHCGLNIDYHSIEKVTVTNKVIKYPCIDYHIKRCQAPCIGLITPEEYQKTVKKITDFLEGKHGDILKQLKKEMADAATNKQFEKAAVIRDKVLAIENITSKQHITDTRGQDRDVINFVVDGGRIFFNLFVIREGQLIDQENFVFNSEEEPDEAEIIAAFIKQYYEHTANLPKELLLPVEPTESKLLTEWLSKLKDSKVKIIVPRKGKKEKILALAHKNADSFRRQARARWQKDQELKDEFKTLQKLLKIKKAVRRIEAYDISHLDGTKTTGSMVVFENGKAKKSDYRHFKLRSTANKNDDYQSMSEVLERRLSKLDILPPEYTIRKKKSIYELKKDKKIIGTINTDLSKLKIEAKQDTDKERLGHILIRYAIKKSPEEKIYITIPLKEAEYYQQVGFKQLKRAPEKFKKIPDNKDQAVFMTTKKQLLSSFGQTPDLIIIDGGKGQLKAGTDIRKKLNLANIPMISLAKKFEQIFIPGSAKPLAIPKSSELSKLFQQIRDEAHRFALSYNKLLRKKALTNPDIT